MIKGSTLALCTIVLIAGCGKKNDASTTGGASSAAPAGNTTNASPSGSADPNACDPKDIFRPKTAKVTFAWTQTPKIDSAPKDGIYASVSGEPFVLDSIEVWTNKKNNDWELRVRSGPLGPSLIYKGAPKVGTFEDKFASNQGYFQVPQKGSTAGCFKQTTSYNGSNARIVKLTKYDEATKTADGSFVTTWQESSGEKRQFWAAGTFKGAKIVIFN